MRAPPPPEVIEAFGATGVPSLLRGGRGTAWRIGELVLRPAQNGEPPLDWQRDTLASIAGVHFRVSLPCRTLAGDFESAGWSAWQFAEGVHEEGRWREIIAVGERFHDALADVPEPAFVAERSDPWAIGDRVAWGDLPPDEFLAAAHLPELAGARRTLDAKCQLVHGDLTGNVLFAPNLPPAIIDFSPYWRPPAYASAVVVADALVWEGADESLLSAVAHIPRFAQFLVRALIMRVVVDWLFAVHEPMRTDRDDPFSTAAALACRLAASES